MTQLTKPNIKARLKLTGSGSGNLMLVLNALGGTNYGSAYINNATPTVVTGQPSALIGGFNSSGILDGEVKVPGVSLAAAGGRVFGTVDNFGSAGAVYGQNFFCIVGNAVQIDTLTFSASAGTLTGTIQIYERD